MKLRVLVTFFRKTNSRKQRIFLSFRDIFQVVILQFGIDAIIQVSAKSRRNSAHWWHFSGKKFPGKNLLFSDISQEKSSNFSIGAEIQVNAKFRWNSAYSSNIGDNFQEIFGFVTFSSENMQLTSLKSSARWGSRVYATYAAKVVPEQIAIIEEAGMSAKSFGKPIAVPSEYK